MKGTGGWRRCGSWAERRDSRPRRQGRRFAPLPPISSDPMPLVRRGFPRTPHPRASTPTSPMPSTRNRTFSAKDCSLFAFVCRHHVRTQGTRRRGERRHRVACHLCITHVLDRAAGPRAEQAARARIESRRTQVSGRKSRRFGSGAIVWPGSVTASTDGASALPRSGRRVSWVEKGG